MRGRLGRILFADDFVGVSESKDQLQKLIDVVHAYCRKWKLKAIVSKSAVMVFIRMFFLEYLNTHTWVWIFFYNYSTGAWVCISPMC